LPSWLDLKSPDNRILGFALEISTIDKDSALITMDLNMLEKAKALNIPCFEWVDYSSCSNDYSGWKVVKLTENELANWYESEVKVNKWDLKINQYILFEVDNNIVDTWIWTKNGFRNISTKKVDSSYLGKFKPNDNFQICALDSLCNNSMVMIKGKAGSGKSLISLSYAMSMIEKGKYEKLIIFINPVATKNSAKLGYYPGSKDEKLIDSQAGNMLSSKFGDKLMLEQLIRQQKIVLLPFSDIRGYDTTGMKAITYIIEAQNLDIELMKLAIQRIGNDCQLIIDGDYNTQVDCQAFEGLNNGMKRVSEIFKGQDFYSEVELVNIYRSKWAEIADKM
jgi:predicted ribonuclease YlaK